jgi:hypothetical protein
MNALKAAIKRYADADMLIPNEWFKELFELKALYEEVK